MLKELGARIVSAVLLFGAVSILLVRFTSGTTAAADASASPSVIPTPDTWVSFSAIMTRTGPTGRMATGRFFQGTDGSQRLESGPSIADVRVIAIHNLTRERYYVYTSGRSWVEHPMQLTPLGKEPPKVLASLPGLAPTQFERFAAYEKREKNGVVGVVVPALNFFTVERRRPDGRRTMFSQIALEHVDPLLFEPPVDAVVKWNSAPGGRIMGSMPPPPPQP